MANNEMYLNLIKPLAWLNGQWEGKGEGGFPTMEPFKYDDRMGFRCFAESFAIEPIIHFEEVAWVHESKGALFKHWETGFFRPINEELIELQVTHNTGRIEVLEGRFDYIDTKAQDFNITFSSTFLRNAEGLVMAVSSQRKWTFKNGELSCEQFMSTEGIDTMKRHLFTKMIKTG